MSANHDSSSAQSGGGSALPGTSSFSLPPNLALPPGLNLNGLDSTQMMSLLRSLNVPGVASMFSKLAEQGNLKEDAAQTLSNLAQAAFNPHSYLNEPGPSTHPRGPPDLGQQASIRPHQPQQQRTEDDGSEDEDEGSTGPSSQKSPPAVSPAPARGRGRNPAMGSDEWARQRKDNHKEVERRRRGNINEGINELGRIVPNGSGEKAKGAILSRAVQYIHHLKENEARNIEKWTLEKLLMDQAMGDLQAQLEEMRRMWEEERSGRQRAQDELEALGGGESHKRRLEGDEEDEDEHKRARVD